MGKEDFITHLDCVYGLVETEYQKCRMGNGGYEEKHLEFILKELKIMRSKCGSHEFRPYYPRGIADSWDYDDRLGNELMELKKENNNNNVFPQAFNTCGFCCHKPLYGIWQLLCWEVKDKENRQRLSGACA